MTSIFTQIMVPTGVHITSQNPPKSHQNSISKGIDFLIDFDICFSTAQDAPRRPRTAQNADLSARLDPRRPQDGPKTAPRGSQEGSKMPPKNGYLTRFFGLGRLDSTEPTVYTNLGPPNRWGLPFLLDVGSQNESKLAPKWYPQSMSLAINL